MFLHRLCLKQLHVSWGTSCALPHKAPFHFFWFARQTGTGRAETRPHPAPRLIATTLTILTDVPPPSDDGKDRKEWYHTSHLAAVVMYVVCLVWLFDMYIVFFSHGSALFMVMRVLFSWVCRRQSESVRVVCMRVWLYYRGCRVLFSTTLWHVTEVRLWLGWEGGRIGTALSLFLAHYVSLLLILLLFYY